MQQRHYVMKIFIVNLMGLFFLCSCANQTDTSIQPGTRVLLDAHNCFPQQGKWTDRIERALKTGCPLAIEQDLTWYTDSYSGNSWSIIAPAKPYSGDEPTLREHFFERIQPFVERALEENSRVNWPLITLNLDFKTNEPEHLSAIWQLLGEYEDWLCTAERGSNIRKMMPIEVKPVLVLTGDNDSQQEIFHDSVEIGHRLRLFGAVRLKGDSAKLPAEQVLPDGGNNYRRWWNNSWHAFWGFDEKDPHLLTTDDMERLDHFVLYAHKMNLWVRFYTLNGHSQEIAQGWNEKYNLKSEKLVQAHWRAAILAGVDYIATDQYEDFSNFKKKLLGAN
jgi:hypothetical protein